MKVYLLPKTIPGKLSFMFIIAMPALFFAGSSFANSLYKSAPAGNTISEDIFLRPSLSLTMLLGMASGIFAFVTGLLGIVKKKERAVSVYIATLIGFLLILFLLGEILFPH